MLAIYRKELRSYFTSPMGYLLIAFLLVINGIYFTAYNLQGGVASYGAVLYNTVIVLLLFCPLLTMRILSEDRKYKTDQLLLCAPVRLSSIVLGKYLAALTVFCVPVVLFCTCPLVLSLYGTVDLPVSYAAVLGYLLLGAACLAVGVFFSSLTENQIVAGLLCFAALLLSYLINGIASMLEAGSFMATLLQPVFTAVDLFTPFFDFLNGVLSMGGMVYYLSVVVLFLFLTVQWMDHRRYN